MAEVQRYAREIVPTFNAYIYFRIGYSLARTVAQLFYRVRLGFADEKTLAGVAPGTTVVFVMNHRSNMDYVLVAFLAAERTALSYAVGEWARIWPLQQLIRSMGAYFVRRNSNSPIYRRVLERYVHMATEARRGAGDVSRRRPVARRPAARAQARPLRLHAEVVRSAWRARHRLRAGGAELRPRAGGPHPAALARPRAAAPQRLVRRADSAALLARPDRPDAARPLVPFRLRLRELRPAGLGARLAGRRTAATSGFSTRTAASRSSAGWLPT